jgi:threonine/homoserine/homoserine lactone efflux protein
MYLAQQHKTQIQLMIQPLIKIFSWGLLISFLGSLPLGPLNLITTFVSVSKGTRAGFAFAAGCILSEMIFVRLAVISMEWISKRRQLFKVLEWITIVIILTLAIFSFIAANRHTGFTSAMPANIKFPFWYGIAISAVEPMKIPFWFLWSTFLLSKSVLIPENNFYNYYTAGIGIGSLLGFLIFIYGGSYFISSIKSSQYIINWIIGIVLMGTAIIQVFRLFNRSKIKT